MQSYYSEVLVIRKYDFFFFFFLQKIVFQVSKIHSFFFPSCVFYGDLYPNQEGYNENTARDLKLLIVARSKFAYGPTDDYPAEKNCIGFVRKGTSTHGGCAVVLSNKEDG
jgi:hypothetical protein